MESNPVLDAVALRIGTHADDADCARLWAQTVAARDGLEPDEETELRAIRKLAKGRISLLVAVEPDGLITAFSLLQRDAQGTDTKTAHLSMLAVHPTKQTHGLGGRLLNATHEQAIAGGFTAITLRVLTSNHRACNLYENTGWVPTGTGRFQNSDRAFTSYRHSLTDR